MAAWLLLLVCVKAVLYSAEAQEPYDELPDIYKKGVDLALDQLNSHAGVTHHFRFLKSVEKSEVESGFSMKFLYHNFNLRPTTCLKGTADLGPQNCPFRNNRPMMDCVVCYKTGREQIETIPKPYVDCIQKPRLTRVQYYYSCRNLTTLPVITVEMKTARVEHCRKMNYNSGAPTLLAVSSG